MLRIKSRCTAVEDGKRCTNSSKDKGGAKGLCPMHYQRTRRSGTLERRNESLGDSAQIVFLLPQELHDRVTDFADKAGVTIASVMRRAVELFLSVK